MTNLPLVVPISKGVDADNRPYCLLTTWMNLKWNSRGGWLTELTVVDNANGTFTFTTKSIIPSFTPVSAVIRGAFSINFDGESIFVVNTLTADSWAAYVDFDNRVATKLEYALRNIPSFGSPKKTLVTDIPNLTTTTTLVDFYTAYGAAYFNIPLQNLLLLQFGANAYTNNDQATVGALIPIIYQFKINNFNVFRQYEILKVFCN